MKILTLYNHKGGVSKTTTTFNLAHLLAKRGNRVLVVDADPQCNITEICLAPLITELDERAQRTGESTELPGTTLLDILKPRIEGAISEVDISAIEVVNVGENIDLIPGSVELNTLEDSIAEAHAQRFSSKTHEKRTYVAIGDLLERFSISQAYDYVFVDVGPSSGALTRSCFLACDAFFMPVAPDRFNLQAIRVLPGIFQKWLKEHAQVYRDYRELGLPVRLGRPIFLGVIAQFFKIHSGKPKPGFQMWIDRIPSSVEENLFPILGEMSTEGRDLTFGLTRENISVTQIPDFGSIAPLMQELGKAVFEIEREDTILISEGGQPWGGATWTNAVDRMARFKACFEDIADRVELLDA